MDVPYLQSANPAARSSSSAVSVSSTKFSSASSTTSSSSGPATSAERRSLSDEEDDDESDADDISGASSPLPPYQYSPPQPQYAAPPQQVCFLDNQHQQPQQPQPVDTADFVCDDCGVSYSRAPDLRRHKASVHNDRDSREKVAATFPCEVCGQVLLSSHGYQGHMRRHYDERPFVCEAPFCGKAFHDSATLARHRRTHSTEHKFECDFCGRRFKRKDNLNTHRKKHQVGGESINPNLLRKPVTRVAADSPPAGTPQAPAYGELPLTSPPYQSPLPSQLQQPSYIPSDQHTYPQHHYTQNPPPPTYYPQHMPYQQRPHYTTVKAEDPTEMDLMRSAQHRRMVMVGNMGPANR
ncbi:hypothetical protein FRB99_008266 [Tulasnella sp. 403]|nr:hypothetical protein FRB99_008266 [Tulasnella sp. 403]